MEEIETIDRKAPSFISPEACAPAHRFPRFGTTTGPDTRSPCQHDPKNSGSLAHILPYTAALGSLHGAVADDMNEKFRRK